MLAATAVTIFELDFVRGVREVYQSYLSFRFIVPFLCQMSTVLPHSAFLRGIAGGKIQKNIQYIVSGSRYPFTRVMLGSFYMYY